MLHRFAATALGALFLASAAKAETISVTHWGDAFYGAPYAVAMESARLAPNAQVSFYPWKDPVEMIPLAVRHVATFLRANDPGIGR